MGRSRISPSHQIETTALAPKEGTLGKPVPGQWQTTEPTQIRLRDGQIICRSPGRRQRTMTGAAGLLDQFLDLPDRDLQTTVRFLKRWGAMSSTPLAPRTIDEERLRKALSYPPNNEHIEIDNEASWSEILAKMNKVVEGISQPVMNAVIDTDPLLDGARAAKAITAAVLASRGEKPLDLRCESRV